MENLVYLLSPPNWPAFDWWPVFRTILATVFVALLAYFVVRMLALARGRMGRGGNLAVIESIAVGNQSMVQLIKAGDKYLVIGVTREKVTILTELEDSQVNVPDTVEVAITPFDSVLKRYLGPKTDSADSQQQGDENEENSKNNNDNN